MPPINKFNQRADVFERGKELEKFLPPRGVHPDKLMVVMDDGKYYRVKRPHCPECNSGEIRYDDRGDKVCLDCGTLPGGSSPMLMDKISAQQTADHRDN